MKHRSAWIIGVIAVGALAAVWWWSQRGTPETSARIELVPVRLGALESAIEASGALAPDSAQSLSFAMGGRVAGVAVTLGQAVTPGETVAKLDTADLDVQEATARANLQTAQSGLSTAQTKLATLSGGPDPVDLEVAKLNLDKSRDARWGVQSQRDAVCGRVDSGRAQETDCNQAQASVQQAEISVRIAELQYNDLLAGTDPDALADATDALSKAEAQRDIAQSALDQATLNQTQATLTSAIAGIVTAIDVSVGDQVGSGQALVTVSDLSRFRVEVSLDETDVSRLKVGQKVRATVGAMSDAQMEGEVYGIAPSAVPQSGVVLYPVVVRLEPSSSDLRAGMTADVSIVTASEADVITLPLRAIQTEDGKNYVEVLDSAAGIDGGPGAAAGRAGPMGGDGSAPPGGIGADRPALPRGSRPGGGSSSPPNRPLTENGGIPSSPPNRTLTEADVTTRRVEVTLGTQTDSQAVILTGLAVGDVVVVKSGAATAAATMPSGGPGGFGPMFAGPGRGR